MADSDIGIWRSAKIYMDEHGDRALALAELQAGEMAAAGDSEGAALWWQIAQKIVELRRMESDRAH